MAGNYREPEWSDSGNPDTRWSEPFFWVFVAVALAVGALAVATFGDDDTDVTFALSAEELIGDQAPVTPVPLPTVAPSPTPVVVAALVEVQYTSEAVIIAGVVPAQAVADALAAAAVELVGAEAVTVDVTIDESSSLEGGAVVVSGEIDADVDRAPFLAVFAEVGLVVDDRVLIAGSNATIAEVLNADPELSQFRDFMTAAGVLADLDDESEEGFTVFAPTNDAVLALDTIALDELSDATQLAEVLRYHLVPGTITSRELGAVTALTSVQGESIPVQIVDGALVVGGARVSVSDVNTVNGVVHVVDAVLLPGTLRTEVALNQIVILDPILFGRGSAEILEESFPILDEAAALLLDSPAGRVEIQGHTDSDGPAETNLSLSQARADAVRDYLVDQGVDTNRLNATGYGETALKVNPENSDDDKAANRRIEFRVD
jgi:outer membrane protein OmpA-like peptidoglycan-associated protein